MIEQKFAIHYDLLFRKIVSDYFVRISSWFENQEPCFKMLIKTNGLTTGPHKDFNIRSWKYCS